MKKSRRLYSTLPSYKKEEMHEKQREAYHKKKNKLLINDLDQSIAEEYSVQLNTTSLLTNERKWSFPICVKDPQGDTP